jgi:hypothetical protein
MVASQAIEPLDRRMQQLGVGWEGDVLGLHRGVDRDPRQISGMNKNLVSMEWMSAIEIPVLMRQNQCWHLLENTCRDSNVRWHPIDPCASLAMSSAPCATHW